MNSFDPGQLRAIRRSRGLTAVAMAEKLGISPAQIHRLEKGQRRLTVQALLEYCDALELDVGRLFSGNAWVPVTGVIDSDFEILPLPPTSADKVLAPPLLKDMSDIGAVRWAASRRFKPMQDHVVFYRRGVDGIPDIAWNKRCLLMRADDSQCLGWPVRVNRNTHVDFGDGPVEFNVDIVWASPVLAVIPPFFIESLEAPDIF